MIDKNIGIYSIQSKSLITDKSNLVMNFKNSWFNIKHTLQDTCLLQVKLIEI